METNVIYNEDCLKGIPDKIDDNSIDMILADLPYNITACDWDSIIPLDKLWEEYKRVIKDEGAIVLTASGKFTPILKMSNIDWYKYEWVWIKCRPSNFLQSRKRPMKYHENVLVFYKEQPIYNPQMEKRKEKDLRNNAPRINDSEIHGHSYYQPNSRGNNKKIFPKSYQKFCKGKEKKYHPTAKPVSLFEYLIKTYTDENNIVLDNVIGSGTTAIACLKTNRKFIGFEKEEKYYNIALKRIGRFDKKYYEDLPEDEKPEQIQMF